MLSSTKVLLPSLHKFKKCSYSSHTSKHQFRKSINYLCHSLIPVFEYKDNKNKNEWKQQRYSKRSFTSSSSSSSSSSSQSKKTQITAGTKKSYCDNITVWQVPVGNGNGNDLLRNKPKRLVDQNEINDDTTVYISQSSGNSENSGNNKFSEGGLEWKVQVLSKSKSTTSKVSPNTKTNNNNNNNNNLIINLYDNFSLSTLSASSTSTILKNNKFIKHFLPTNYPQSVDKGYSTFVSYCFLSNICGSAAMVLSTQTLLLAVGVGSASSAPMAGALNWVMKDGFGQLGGVLFASRITSNENGNYTIDKDPKRWRMVSALSMDGATLLEILSPLFPGYFLIVASIANVGKNIGFLTASASRAALHQSLALSNNLGDLTAKAGSQSIVASLLGTGVGIGLSPLIGEDYMYVTIGFICLSSIHQYCTFKSLKAVALKKLNRHRLNIVLDLFFDDFASETSTSTENGDGNKDQNKDTDETFKYTKKNKHHPYCPETVSKYESFIPCIHPDDSHKWLMIGCPLIDIASTPQEFNYLIRECLGGNNNNNKKWENEKYILNCDVGVDVQNMNVNDIIDDKDTNSIKLKKVMLTFHHNATDIDLIRGMFHAHTVKMFASKQKQFMNKQNNDGKLSLHHGHKMNNHDDNARFQIVAASYQFMEEHFDSFISNLEESSWEIKGNSVHLESSSSFRIRIDTDAFN